MWQKGVKGGTITDTAVRTVPYLPAYVCLSAGLDVHKVDEEDGAAESCIICFGDFAPGEELCRLPCLHLYHANVRRIIFACVFAASSSRIKFGCNARPRLACHVVIVSVVGSRDALGTPLSLSLEL